MRWPLRNQIVGPMGAVLLVTAVAISMTTAVLAGRRTTLELKQLLNDIARTVREARFPLTESVLLQMRGLSGTEFILWDEHHRMIARTIRFAPDVDTSVLSQAEHADSVSLERRVELSSGQYFHTTVSIPARGSISGAQTLHLLYPVANYLRAWREAVLPPIVIGAVALVVMTLLSFWIAARVTRPLATLTDHVGQIADGQYSPMPLPPRDDEIRDVTVAVNRLAEMLTNYEAEVRRTERLKTLGHLGGGIAHQLRNAVTGCRLALDLHLVDCPLGGADESVTVAKRQLSLMETSIQRFLTLGQLGTASQHQPIELGKLVNDLVPLVMPAARHASVQLRWSPPAVTTWIAGDAAELEQAVINLLLNSIEAAADPNCESSARWVEIVCEPRGDRVLLTVRDSGSGPQEPIRSRLFTPFATDKPGGVGLGLAVTQEISRRHGGSVIWTRENSTTSFCVDLPLSSPAKQTGGA